MKAVYGQIYEALLDQIQGGDYPYQSFIPSEAELCELYACSHNTVRRAVRLLTQEGYVQPINGKGVRVIYLPSEREDFSMGGIETFKEAARRNNFEAVTKVVSLGHEMVSKAFALESGFPEGSDVTHVERVRLMDGRARILDRNWYLTGLVPDITPEVAADSIYAYIEGTLGMRVTTSKRTFLAEKARRADRELLDLGGYDFVAVVVNHTFNDDGVMFEYTQSRHHPEHFSFTTVALRDQR
ncbi:UTRA domain-containing protein [Olsenella sp. Marseille-P4559]|uniref:UTRA domain-containing protein n=1 Tax=Olsenella sp. Marseille-P4559 TaxID=2364795 RepID=UPI001030C0AC|nr:UTRA domain-containing protein [Olsenella sp. Marseille-P4559]